MNVTLITATVAGFVLVIDPNNEEGMRERIEYTDTDKMAQRIKACHVWERAHYEWRPGPQRHLSPEYYTLLKLEDETIEQRAGYDCSGKTHVGDTMYKASCACGKTDWWRLDPEYPNANGTYTCEDCGAKKDRGDDFEDFNNYDRSREREY